jgi:membrane-associated phospholipid phosphatase
VTANQKTKPEQVAEEAADALQSVDSVVAEAVLPYRKTMSVRLLGTLSEVGDQPQMRTLSGGLIAVGMLLRNARLAKAGVRMLLAHELATAAKNFIKVRVDRTRPRSLGGDDEGHKIRAGETTEKEETSFPSGHSAGAAAVARAFIREFPEYSTPANAAAAGVALAQIPRCAHYPTDVGVGLAIGIASEAVVDTSWRMLAGGGRRD